MIWSSEVMETPLPTGVMSIATGVGVGAGVAVEVAVGLGSGVGNDVGVAVAGAVGGVVGEGAAVGVGVGAVAGVGVGVSVAVGSVGTGKDVGVAVGVDVGSGVGMAVGVGAVSSEHPVSRMDRSAAATISRLIAGFCMIIPPLFAFLITITGERFLRLWPFSVAVLPQFSIAAFPRPTCVPPMPRFALTSH